MSQAKHEKKSLKYHYSFHHSENASLILFNSEPTCNTRSREETTLLSSQPGDSCYFMPYGLLLEKQKPPL